MIDFLFVGGFILFVVLSVALGLWLVKSRCPACGKLFAGRVLGSTEVASVDTADFGYDDQRGEYRNVPRRQTGYLIKRQCRFCENTWDRMESQARQLDRLTDDRAKEYRDKKLF